MKATVKNLENKEVGSIDLLDGVFGVKPRRDILTRMVNYQLAKRRSGNHKVKVISEVSGTTKKPWAQKGTGRARQGSLRSPQFRKGGVIFGPVVRDHAHELPKKVRQLALCMALATKQQDGKLIVLDNAKLTSHKTKALADKFTKMGVKSALIIDGANLDENFAKAARNIKHIDVLPEQGANVYDILRRDVLVLTKNAVEQLQERLK
ncbi:MAG TPA: 50S ribosomal protein L4 [Alphaproteobacteria bacterium]|nr:50S ribosomal protein L4 [Alphaproteobacteria bacterium]